MRKDVAGMGDGGADPKASAALAEMKDRMLERMENPQSVFFGRLDIDDGDQYYVGPQLIRDERSEPLVISFAAPAAQPFYEATPQDPMHLTLRRRFTTDAARLRGIADEVFVD